MSIALNNTPRYTGILRIAGTRSFRLSCGMFFGQGGNTQNIHEAVGECLVAPEGYTFVQCDQRSAESVVVANLARRGAYYELLRLGMKPHCLMALLIFAEARPDWFAGLPHTGAEYLANALAPATLAAMAGWRDLDKRIKTALMEYAIGKMVIHASSYRMGWRTFVLSVIKNTSGALVLTAAQAKHYLAMFARAFPEIIEWQLEVIFEARRKRVLHNCMGYPRVCGRKFNHGYENELISFKPQSTVGVLTHLATRRIRGAIPNCHILGNVHDAYVVAVPDTDVETTARLMVETFHVPLRGRGGEIFYIDADPKAGRTFTNMETVKLA